MPSDTKNVKLGPCAVLFDGVDLGYTQGGVEVEVQTNTHEVKVDQFGDTPINDLVTGRIVTAKVPLAETTVENMARLMPGSTVVGNGVKASQTVTFVTAAPVNNDAVVIAGTAFTFKTSPVGVNDMAIPASITAAATALAAKINAAASPVSAVAVGAVVTLTADDAGQAGNGITLTKTGGTNITLGGAVLSGGVDATKIRMVVNTGVGLSMLAYAKELTLRPQGTNGEDDFIIYKAATPGALNFAYKLDTERVFIANFKGYVTGTGDLFAIGDRTA